MVRVHKQDAADAFLLVLGRVQDRRPFVELAGIDPEIGQLADIRVGHDLEGERGKWLPVRSFPLHLEIAAHASAYGCGNIQWAGQKVHDGIEHRLDAFVPERRSAKNRHPISRNRGSAKGCAKLLGRNRFLREILLHQIIVVASQCLDQFEAKCRGFIEVLSRNGDNIELFAQIVLVNNGMHLKQIDYPSEPVL